LGWYFYHRINLFKLIEKIYLKNINLFDLRK
jgi:hypothetical protein